MFAFWQVLGVGDGIWVVSGDMVLEQGYCYMRIFSAYNDAFGLRTFDLRRVRRSLGRFPLIRQVFAFVFVRIRFDFYVPGVRLVRPGM